MKSSIKSLLTVFCLMFPLLLSGQDLPKLGTAPGIVIGKFPNGLTYYLVTNKASYGYADYALVQKGVSDRAAARTELDSLSNFKGQRPYKFLAARGVGYGQNGYITHGEDFTMFRFGDVPTSDVATADTNLMMLFDISAGCPTEQAIIISGDIDANSIKGKMSIFSLMISQRAKAKAAAKYEWKPSEKPQVVINRNKAERISSIDVTYRIPRTSSKYINTIQKLVSDLMYSEMDMILTNRVRDLFKSAGVPLADVRTSRKTCYDGPGDEAYSLTVFVSKANIDEAVKLLGQAIAGLDKKGVSQMELQDAKDEYLSITCKEAESRTLTNAEYLDKCASAWMYGTDLAPVTAARDFIKSKNLPIEKDTELFNDFIGSILDKDQNLVITLDTPLESLSEEHILDMFQAAWRGNWGTETVIYRPHYGDTLALASPNQKLKLKLNTPEPVSGGATWTFSNGMKVVYKKVATPGQFHYDLMIRGGYTSIKDLNSGEGAFVSDMLKYFDIAGKTSSEFNSMLKANGISMNGSVGISDLQIKGSAPTSKFTLLLKSLISMANDRSFNNEEFNYFKSCEDLRIEMQRFSAEGMAGEIDAIMRPDYNFTQFKHFNGLQKDLYSRASQYFDAQFEKVDDGMLILVGDLDELEIQKILCKYLGGFKTSKALAAKPQAQYELRSGWSTYTWEASHPEEKSINMAMSTATTLSPAKCFATSIAMSIIRKRLASALCEHGMWVETSDNFEFFPKERISVMVSCHPVAEDGLPSSISASEPLSAINDVRSAIKAATSSPVAKGDLNIFKGQLLKQVTYQAGLPQTIVNNIATRYSEGKDLMTKFTETINGIKPEDVQEVLTELGGGSQVEIIID